jgi:hypothetical protein
MKKLAFLILSLTFISSVALAESTAERALREANRANQRLDEFDTCNDDNCNLSITQIPEKKKNNRSSSTNNGLIAGRYRDNRDGTVTDVKTGLQWMRCAMGQEWDGSTCRGEAAKYQWNQVVNKYFTYFGRTDWHLPTREELKTLVYCSSGWDGKYMMCNFHHADASPTILSQAFPQTPSDVFWSSSPYASNSNLAYTVFFLFGNSNGDDKNDGYAVRLVRAGQ